jgi:hypothetical protein
VLKSDSTHELIRGSVNVDFALCNPESNITPGDVVVINRATVYTVIAGEIVNIEHNEA